MRRKKGLPRPAGPGRGIWGEASPSGGGREWRRRCQQQVNHHPVGV